MNREKQIKILEEIRRWVEYHELSTSCDDEMELKNNIVDIVEEVKEG